MSVIFAFGASRGIGSVFVRDALSLGHEVVLFARSNPSALGSEFISVDFSQEARFRELLAQKAEQYGSIDHLVFAQKYRGEPSFELEMLVNVKTLITAIETTKKRLKKSVVAISSSVARKISKTQGVEYHASKAALESAIKYYALNLDGVRVNGVAPTLTLKPENSAFYGANPELTNQYKALYPGGEMLRAQDVSAAMLWLLEAKFINGEILTLDAGANLIEIESIVKR